MYTSQDIADARSLLREILRGCENANHAAESAAYACLCTLFPERRRHIGTVRTLRVISGGRK